MVFLVFSRPPNYLNLEKHLENQRAKLMIPLNSPLNITKEFFQIMTHQAVSSHTLSLIVNWIMEIKKYEKYAKSIWLDLYDANMIYIDLIKEEIWIKRYFMIDEIKKKCSNITPLIHEIERFDRVVVPHFNDKYFEYAKVIRPRNIFENATAEHLQILTHVAAELTKSLNPNIKNYVLPVLKPGYGIMKQQALIIARSRPETKNKVN